MPVVDPITDLHWISPGMIAMKNTHDAPGLTGFMKLSPDFGSGEMVSSGAFGDTCIPSPDSGATACVGGRGIAIVQPGRKETIFHTANALDPALKQRSVEAQIGETVATATEPSFKVGITQGKFHGNANGSPIPLAGC
jgi:hypothetical protein